MVGAKPPAGDLMAMCESYFERDVLARLLSKGYRVRPQMGALGYRIDLVVEGAGDRRVAIECDGDKYHGPERWADDIQRQRMLERDPDVIMVGEMRDTEIGFIFFARSGPSTCRARVRRRPARPPGGCFGPQSTTVRLALCDELHQSETRTTVRLRTPCAPWMRTPSISAVADGPVTSTA
jgi:hypothetical protein